MAIKQIEANIDVLTASKQRIKNLFNTGAKIYLSFSSGKDSLCMSSITYDLIRQGEINPKQLEVIFIDEEGLYPSMVENAERWRKKFLSIGVPFKWFCLPLKQVSVIDTLSAQECWITWQDSQKDKWMRDLPPFAIHSHPILEYEGQMNYQTFCDKYTYDGITMVGLRTAESLTRLQTVAKMNKKKTTTRRFYPIYDWTDNDVWFYIKERKLEFPEIYMHLYEAGVQKRLLRLCCFFGDCSTQGLRWVCETDPDLWERIQRRMPNAELALLYWDSEMFRRSTKNRRELEKDEAPKDYKELCKDLLFTNTDKYTLGKDTANKISLWRRLYIKIDGMASNDNYKLMYESITYGDPKLRQYRILLDTVFGDYTKRVKKETS